jgi:hypothetical protein
MCVTVNIIHCYTVAHPFGCPMQCTPDFVHSRSLSQVDCFLDQSSDACACPIAPESPVSIGSFHIRFCVLSHNQSVSLHRMHLLQNTPLVLLWPLDLQFKLFPRAPHTVRIV